MRLRALWRLLHERHYQRGGIVEFAMMIPFVLMLLFAVVDAGYCLLTYNIVTNSARVGARYASVRGSACAVAGCPATQSSIQTYVQGISTGLQSSSSLTVTTTWASNGTCTAASPSAAGGAGCVVTVTTSYPFKYVMPLLSSKSWTMSSTAKMVISQ